MSGVAGKLPPRRLTALLLGISVAFALAILAVSAFLEPERSQTLMYALIAIWWIPFSVLSSASAASGRGRCGKRA